MAAYSESVKDEVLGLLKAGVERKKILEQTGISKTTLKRWFPEHNIRPAGRPRPDREEIVEAARSGMSDRELAIRFNMTKAAVEKFRVRNGVRREPVEYWRGPLTEEQVARIGELLDEGYSVKAVGQMTGHAWKTIDKYYPGRQFTREQITEAAVMGRQASKIYRKLEKNAA